ncbi:hypothetical protein BpHYR1_052365 [Brachionus plicatilis]|nr:hypothetical protein BpHYR1_052365 [Brachionus plicatilis]
MKLAEKISQLDNDVENPSSIPNDTNNFELIE